MQTKPLFTEKQKFNQWWLWLLLLSATAVTIIIPFSQSNSLSTSNILLNLLIPLLIVVLFLAIRLETVIDLEGISVRFFLLHLKLKRFLWQGIEKIYVREYAPLSEYGGWGLRYSINNGKAIMFPEIKGYNWFLPTEKNCLSELKKPEEITAILKQINQLKSN